MRQLSEAKLQEVRRKIREHQSAKPGAKCDEAYADLFPDQVMLHQFRVEWGRALREQAATPVETPADTDEE